MTNQPPEETHEYVVFKSDQRFPCKSNSWKTQRTLCIRSGHRLYQIHYLKHSIEFLGWKVPHSLPLTYLDSISRDNKQACNIRHPSVCFFVVKTHHCNLGMDRSVHFTQCQLFFRTSLVMICKTNTLVQFTLAYAQHDFSAQPS